MARRLIITVDYPDSVPVEHVHAHGCEIAGSFLHPFHPCHEPGGTCIRATYSVENIGNA